RNGRRVDHGRRSCRWPTDRSAATGRSRAKRAMVSMVDRRTVLRFGAFGAAGTMVTAIAPAAQAAPGSGAAGGSAAQQDYDSIIGCDSSAAGTSDGTRERSRRATNTSGLHHMVSPNVGDCSGARAVEVAQAWQDMQMDDNGWADRGQHLTFSRGGYVLEG